MQSDKKRELVLYLIFGILTTLVNFAAFYLFSLALGEKLYLISNAAAWLFAVAFAFVTNKIIVFRATDSTRASLLRECAEFLAARVLSLAIEELGLLLLVGVFGMSDMRFGLVSGQMAAKIILAVVVVILNYICSKFIIFKKS